MHLSAAGHVRGIVLTSVRESKASADLLARMNCGKKGIVWLNSTAGYA